MKQVLGEIVLCRVVRDLSGWKSRRLSLNINCIYNKVRI